MVRKSVRETQEELTEDEPELAPLPDAGPGEDISPPEESEDPRARSRRRAAAAETSLDEAPHAADWFSSTSSRSAVATDPPGDTSKEDREALAQRIVARLNPEQ